MKNGIYREGLHCYFRHREKRLVDGEIKDMRPRVRLGPATMTQAEAELAAEEYRKRLDNKPADVRSTMRITEFIDAEYMPHYVRQELKPSTADGYAKLARRLKPFWGDEIVRDFRCVNATKLLRELWEKLHWGKRTLFHAKAFGSGVFAHAKCTGCYEGVNPFDGARVPRKARASEPTRHNTLEQIIAGLAALEGHLQGQVALGLTSFAGLRPGEARGLCWEDDHGHVIDVRSSVWRSHRTDPKTPGSAKQITIIQPLRGLLDQLRASDGDPKDGPILRNRHGRPRDLDDLFKNVIRPRLTRCLVCHQMEAKHVENGHAFALDTALAACAKGGYYPGRRGIGTAITSVAKDAGLACKGHLRNTLAVAQANYIKEVPADTQAALQKIEQLVAGEAHRA